MGCISFQWSEWANTTKFWKMFQLRRCLILISKWRLRPASQTIYDYILVDWLNLMMIANKTFESIKIIFISMWEKDKTQLLMKIESCNCNNCYLKGIISKIADVYFWLTAADGSVQYVWCWLLGCAAVKSDRIYVCIPWT